MSNGQAGDGRLSKNERREAAREKAKVLREQQRKRDVRNRWFLWGGVGVVVVAIVVGVTLIIASTLKPAGPGPLNMASDGISIGQGFVAAETPALAADADPVPSTLDTSSGAVNITMYVDYMCPFCGQFEATNIDQIKEWVSSGAATVEYHPLAILDRSSLGTKFSSRATNAAACVANYSPNNFFDFNALMFANQPEENSEGLDNNTIKGLVEQSGAGSIAEINECIDSNQFKSWVSNSTARALQGPIPNSTLEKITGTPTVLVNGQKYEGSLSDPDVFSAFVYQVAGETYSTSTATPTPTATPDATPAPTN